MPCDCDRGKEIYRRSPAGKREAAAAARDFRARERRARQSHDGRLAGAGGDE